MLPATKNSLTLDEEFLLLDNLNDPEEADSAADNVGYPFKTNFTMVLFCVAGSMHFRLNLKEFELKPYEAMIIPQGSIGECVTYSPDFRLALVACSNTSYFAEMNANSSVEFRKYLLKNGLMRFTPEEMDETLQLYQLMRKKLADPHYAYKREALRGYMQVLAANGAQWMANRNREQAAAPIENRQEQLFDQFLALVEAHFQTERELAFYADKLCITPKYLSQVIRKVSGRYASDWIKDFVILEAKALLKSKKYTVQQVSDRLNFTNASFFGKFFKAAVGCSPRRYSIE